MGTAKQTKKQVNFMDTIHKELELDLKPNEQALAKVLDRLLSVYFKRVPDAKKIFTLFNKQGDLVANDHVAFRSISVVPLLKIFLPYGYKVQFDDNENQIPFNFTSKKLTAIWLKHPNNCFPRIFISEIRLEELPKTLYQSEQRRTLEIQKIIIHYFDNLTDPIDSVDPFNTKEVVNYLHTRLWPIPSYQDYSDISEISEYLSWVLYNDFYLNHFTLSVNQLHSFNVKERIQSIISTFQKRLKDEHKRDHSDQDIYHDYLESLNELYKTIMTEFNQLLISKGFTLNNPKNQSLNISPDQLLLQSSTKANLINAQFADQSQKIPGSYVEFAFRGLKTEIALQLLENELNWEEISANDYRDGFETQNANSIFESTYTKGLDSPENESKISDTSFKHSREYLIEFLDNYQMTHPHLVIF